MILHGRVHDGVVVLENGDTLPEGARVTVIPDIQNATPDSVEMTPEEHARIASILDRIAALPCQGNTDPFSGADHDAVYCVDATPFAERICL